MNTFLNRQLPLAWRRRLRRVFRLFAQLFLAMNMDMWLMIPGAMASDIAMVDRLNEAGDEEGRLELRDFQFGATCDLLALLSEEELQQLTSLRYQRFFRTFCTPTSATDCASFSPLFAAMNGRLNFEQRGSDTFCRYVPGDVVDLPPGSTDMEEICVHCG